MPSPSPATSRFHRVEWTIFLALIVLAIVAGIWPITGVLTTWMPVLAVPPAAGLPSLLPPLRLAPLGETTWAHWAADLAGVAIMLLAAWGVLQRASRRRAGVGRAVACAVWTSAVAVTAGNLVRAVFQSFVVHADFGTYLGTVVAGVVVSFLTGALLGLIVGVAAAIIAATDRRRYDDAPRPAEGTERVEPVEDYSATSAS